MNNLIICVLQEREPYIIEAKRVNSSYMKALLVEVNNMQEVIQ